MPFNRKWADGAYVVDRSRTGAPPPPEPGTVVEADGTVVADSATIDIPPATPVKVNLPGPGERIIDERGNLTPRWRRFFEELYRRTGGINDNINRATRVLVGAGSTDALIITGNAPSIGIDEIVPAVVGSMVVSGTTPTATLSGPTTASISISGETPTIA